MKIGTDTGAATIGITLPLFVIATAAITSAGPAFPDCLDDHVNSGPLVHKAGCKECAPWALISAG